MLLVDRQTSKVGKSINQNLSGPTLMVFKEMDVNQASSPRVFK